MTSIIVRKISKFPAATSLIGLCLLSWGAPAAASTVAEPTFAIGAGSMDAFVMIMLLGGFRIITWIAQAVERRTQRKAALAGEY